MLKKSITKDEINTLPLYTHAGKIEIVANKIHFRNAIDALRGEGLLGFDTESRPAFKKGICYGVSLLQLATSETTYLFRLNRLSLQEELVEILSDEEIQKVGLAIHDDIKGLQKLTPFSPGGFIELADLAKSVDIKNPGIRSLAAILLQKRISKGAKLTNWEAERLTNAQIRYAAIDARVALDIYQELSQLK